MSSDDIFKWLLIALFVFGPSLLNLLKKKKSSDEESAERSDSAARRPGHPVKPPVVPYTATSTATSTVPFAVPSSTPSPEPRRENPAGAASASRQPSYVFAPENEGQCALAEGAHDAASDADRDEAALAELRAAHFARWRRAVIDAEVLGGRVVNSQRS